VSSPPLVGDPEERRRLERVLADAERALDRLARATQHKSRWRTVATAYRRAQALVQLGRYADGLAACNELLAGCRQASDVPTQVLVAGALQCRAVALRGLGDVEGQLGTCDESIRRFAGASDPVLQEAAAQAFLARAQALEELGQPGEAAAARSELVRRFGEVAGTPALHRLVAAARDGSRAGHGGPGAGAGTAAAAPANAAGPPVAIRPAVQSELAATAELILRAFAEYLPLVEAGFAQHFEADARTLADRLGTSEVLVAERGGALIGTVTLIPEGRHYAMAGWPPGWAAVRLLAVDPAARGSGAGRMLVAACVARARALGVPAIGLHTATFMTPARRVYEGLGFQRVPELDVALGGSSPALAYRLWLA
jgi:ribosomal protein S18 acetylase RimI-like enzyme